MIHCLYICNSFFIYYIIKKYSQIRYKTFDKAKNKVIKASLDNILIKCNIKNTFC